MVVSEERLDELYSKMLAAQDKGGGFDLTFDEIVGSWGYRSKAAASTYLPLLVEAGYVVTKKRGQKTIYRAIDRRKYVRQRQL